MSRVLSSRFEGFDARIVDHLCTDAISIGPYVLSGGELPAMVLVDAIARRLPGALAAGSGENESFGDALDGGIEYPHYTRPAEFRGWEVPDVLLSGNHAHIDGWRDRPDPAAEHRVSDVEDRPEGAEQPPPREPAAQPGRATTRTAGPRRRRRPRGAPAGITAGPEAPREPTLGTLDPPPAASGLDAPPPPPPLAGTRATPSTG